MAAAVMQALTWAARGFAGSLYDGPNGMELAIFNDLCFCSLRSKSGLLFIKRSTHRSPHFEQFVSDISLFSS